jgi:hypothetical protein
LDDRTLIGMAGAALPRSRCCGCADCLKTGSSEGVGTGGTGFLQHFPHSHRVVVEMPFATSSSLKRFGSETLKHIAPGLPSNHDVPNTGSRQLLRNIRGFNLNHLISLMSFTLAEVNQ